MSVRQERIQEQLVQELSEMIRRDLRDPRIGFLTLTGAEITADLRHAKVFVSIYGTEEEQKQTLKALNGASGILRGEFARRVHLRLAPDIEFRLDEGIARGQRIFELLHSVEGDLKPQIEPVEPAADTEATHEAS
jgi:ribosome-binding factor A